MLSFNRGCVAGYLVLLYACLFQMTAEAQVQTVVYEFRDTYLTPDITNPDSFGQEFVPMFGQFEWTYMPGDFANGTGRLLWLDIPEWNVVDSLPAPLEADVNLNYLDIFLPGEWDLYAFDIHIVFNEPLSPDQYSTMDNARSLFSIDVLFRDRAGHVSIGWVDIVPATCDPDLNQDGTLDFFDVTAFLNAFAIQDPVADMTGDGLFDFFDIARFLDAFAAGCP